METEGESEQGNHAVCTRPFYHYLSKADTLNALMLFALKGRLVTRVLPCRSDHDNSEQQIKALRALPIVAGPTFSAVPAKNRHNKHVNSLANMTWKHQQEDPDAFSIPTSTSYDSCPNSC